MAERWEYLVTVWSFEWTTRAEADPPADFQAWLNKHGADGWAAVRIGTVQWTAGSGKDSDRRGASRELVFRRAL